MEGLLRIFRRSMGFRQQLVLTFTVGILCLAVLSSLAIATLSNRTVRGTLVEQGRRATEAFAAQSTLALLYQSTDNAQAAVEATLAFPDIQGVAIYDREHRLLLTEGERARPPEKEVSWPETPQIAGETSEAWFFVAPVYAHPAQTEAEESPFGFDAPEPELIGFVRVVMVKKTLAQLTQDILQGNLFVSAALAILLLLVLLGMTARMTTPLKSLAENMRRAELGEKNVRAEVRGPKDIMDMESAFNTMMAVLEAREQELEKARNAALESARVKGEFAANVSHELRTPLNGILGMLELLQNMGLTPKQQEYLQVACSSGETLLGLIGDILDFSRIESGKLRLDPVDFSLAEVLEDVVSLLAGQAQQKDLDLGYVVARNVPAAIRGDASRLRQILINLVGNAVKFTGQGEVAIDVRVLERPAQKPVLHFQVKDTGIGIPPEAQGRIFEAFSQADSSTTRQYGGTGLGLAICRQLVALMGGAIGVESQRGQGSAFWFTVPLEAAKVPQKPLAFNRTEAAGLRVLIVDDSAVTRRSLVQTCHGWGMYAVSVAEGTQALELLRRAAAQGRAYDLVLLDEAMCGLSGAALAHRIVADPQIAPIKIIFMGSQSQSAVEVASFPGVVGYVSKPVQQSSLYDSIMTSLQPGGHGEPPALPPIPMEEETGLWGGRLLVVEDNRANQQVALGMLEQLGCRVDVAANGQEALERMTRQSYDLVLMDCHMPQLDGYEATRRFRALEAGRPPLPIVAMTANVNSGDSDRCRAVGMSDYLPKPLKLNALRDKLQYWLGSRRPGTGQLVAEGASLKPTPVNEHEEEDAVLEPRALHELRTSVGEAFYHMIEVFLEDTPLYLEQLQKAIATHDANSLREVAHSIKGSARNFGATQLARLAKQLEDLGKAGSSDDAQELVTALLAAHQRVQAALQQETPPEQEVPVCREEGPSRVLIVDDDRGLRVALRNVLAQDGYRIDEAGNGKQALALCERHLPDLVLMDAVMPLVDGFEACSRLRDLPNSAHMPVLIITALDDESSIKRAFSAGATDYIPKPVHFAVLRRRVARLLDASRAQQHVYQLAYHDTLTGLPNRALFSKRLEESLTRLRPEKDRLAILFLDLDRFKLVNDTLGHDVGDLLLKAAADRIIGCLRHGDTVARLGGDEFTIILEGIRSPEIAAGVATKVCEVLSKPFVFMAQEMYISTSVGIALYPDDGKDIKTLIKHADTAMFQAKEQGNGFQFYEQGMEIAAARRLAMEAALRRALEREEFTVCYQPQADLATGNLVGLEALIRWRHPQRGLVSPAEFIPLAEETGLIVPIGEWVLREACTQVQSWLQRGLGPFQIAVNVSSRQLEKGDLVSKVVAILKETGLPPERLELEITESVVMQHAETVIPMFRELRAMGIKLAIDDFGTGYSSLNYLKRFPVDILKIDRSFVCDIASNPDDAAILAGIIALARSLRLKVVAEGVESREQEAILKTHWCDLIQGFYLSQPLSATVIEQTLLSQDRDGYSLSSKIFPLSTRGRVG